MSKHIQIFLYKEPECIIQIDYYNTVVIDYVNARNTLKSRCLSVLGVNMWNILEMCVQSTSYCNIFQSQLNN